jgi:hypothetical protein
MELGRDDIFIAIRTAFRTKSKAKLQLLLSQVTNSCIVLLIKSETESSAIDPRLADTFQPPFAFQ